MKKNCKFCNSEFIAKRKGKIFCSNRCIKRNYWAKYGQAINKKKREMRKSLACQKNKTYCVVCKKEIIPKNILYISRVKYCSKYCLNKNRNENLQKNTEKLLIHNLRNRTRLVLNNFYDTKKKMYKNNHLIDFLGCTPEYLKNHLQKQFCHGMSWKNHGLWHIDHIKPLSSAKNVDEIYNLCHYTNLQPLWAFDNLKKADKNYY